jgi:predicted lipid-binding transport protein (Tim44 family)
MDVAQSGPDPLPNTASTGGATFNGSARQRLPVLLRSIGSDVSLLVKQQADLAKQEMKEKAGEKAMGGGLLLGAGILALFVLGFLGFAGAAALDLVLPAWAAFLIVAAVYLIGAFIAAMTGRRALTTPATPEQTMQTVKEDVEWAKRKLRR